MRCAALPGSAPRRPRPPGDGSAPGRWPKTRPTRATRLDWRVYPWESSFFIQGYLMQVKTNKVVLHLLYVVQHIVVRQRSSAVLRSRGVMETDAPTFWHHLCTLSVLLSQSLQAGSDIQAVYS